MSIVPMPTTSLQISSVGDIVHRVSPYNEIHHWIDRCTTFVAGKRVRVVCGEVERYNEELRDFPIGIGIGDDATLYAFFHNSTWEVQQHDNTLFHNIHPYAEQLKRNVPVHFYQVSSHSVAWQERVNAVQRHIRMCCKSLAYSSFKQCVELSYILPEDNTVNGTIRAREEAEQYIDFLMKRLGALVEAYRYELHSGKVRLRKLLPAKYIATHNIDNELLGKDRRQMAENIKFFLMQYLYDIRERQRSYKASLSVARDMLEKINTTKNIALNTLANATQAYIDADAARSVAYSACDRVSDHIVSQSTILNF